MTEVQGSDNSWVTRVSAGGRVVVPSRFRRSLGIKKGDELVITLEDGEIRMRSREQARKRAQELVSQLIPKKVSLARELIAERRKAASLE